MKPVVWITGAGGLIGNYLVQTAPQYAPQFQAVGLMRAQLDLANFAAVRRAFTEQRPQLIIHCAAIAKPPVCQANPVLARLTNVEVVKKLAELAMEIPFVFFSTDLVFDGQKGNYVEADAVNPITVYAKTKVEAEKIVSAHPRHLIIRTSINGGVSPTGDRGFNEQMRLAWQRGQMLNLFTDEFRCPIPAEVTAQAVWELVDQQQTGVFHLGGSEKLSRYEIGKLLVARTPERKAQITPDTLKNYRGAPRTPDVSMDCTKVQKLLSLRLPGLTEWLAANPNEVF